MPLRSSNPWLRLCYKYGIVLRESFETDSNNILLLINSKNAFNCLNRDLALKNIETFCPLLRIQRHPTCSKAMLATTGTTQEYPPAIRCMESQSWQ